jgi:ABC-2 type transport system permease protein
MSKLWSLTRRELGAYFLTPSAYIVLALFLLISGYFFSTYVIAVRQADMRPVLSEVAVLFLFLLPALTSRLWAEERKQGTDELLMTAPLSTAQIVVAKYLAALLLFSAYLAVTLLYPVMLAVWGPLDWAAVLTGYLGLLLFGGAALAVGLYASSLTDSQMLAAISAFAMLLGLWISSWAGGALPPGWAPVLNYLSFTTHYQDFSKGLLDTSHGLYFLTLIAGFLFLTARRLESIRTR